MQLTWNGTPEGYVGFGTSGHAAGDTYLLAAQVPSAVTTSGVYPWNFKVQASFSGSSSTDWNYTDDAAAVVTDSTVSTSRDNSAFGPGGA